MSSIAEVISGYEVLISICDLCQKNRDYVSKMEIEHFTSFNLVPGSSILDNYFQNDVILEKQLSSPIVLRK
jgi:hypothetical protein